MPTKCNVALFAPDINRTLQTAIERHRIRNATLITTGRITCESAPTRNRRHTPRPGDPFK